MAGTSVVSEDGVVVAQPQADAVAVAPAPAANTAIAALDTQDNRADLAKVMMSEASVGNKAEKTCVGFTVINRMLRNGKTQVKDVWKAYAHNQEPTASITELAGNLLKGTVADPTGGATHYYSPRGMPDESADAAKLAKYDVGGGLEQVEGHGKTYRPTWATASNFTLVSVPDVREWYYKFYRVAGTGAVR